MDIIQKITEELQVKKCKKTYFNLQKSVFFLFFHPVSPVKQRPAVRKKAAERPVEEVALYTE